MNEKKGNIDLFDYERGKQEMTQATAELAEKSIGDDEVCEALFEKINNAVVTDDEIPAKIGKNVLKAYVANDADAMLIAITGWSMETLLKKAVSAVSGDDSSIKDVIG